MTRINRSDNAPGIIFRGIHLGLTAAMKAALEKKAARLFRHKRRILRLRIDVDHGWNEGLRVFTAKGYVEIAGPDICATATTDDAYASMNLVIGKLDRMLRKRMTARLQRRTADDIRAHDEPIASVWSDGPEAGDAEPEASPAPARVKAGARGKRSPSARSKKVQVK